MTKTTEPILVGSEVWLELELESAFPVDLRFDDVAVSLTHGPLTSVPTVTSSATGTDGSSEKSRRKINRPVLHTFSGTGNAGPGIHRTPSNRSTSSVVSSAASSLIQVRLLMKPGMIYFEENLLPSNKNKFKFVRFFYLLISDKVLMWLCQL